MLGVTVTEKLSFTEHVDNVINSCARSMYAISVLRSHGMYAPLLHQVFQSVVISKLSPTLLQRGGAFRLLLSASASRLSFVELLDLVCGSLRRLPRNLLTMLMNDCYVAAKATYIRLLLAKWGFFGPSSVTRGWTHIVLG